MYQSFLKISNQNFESKFSYYYKEDNPEFHLKEGDDRVVILLPTSDKPWWYAQQFQKDEKAIKNSLIASVVTIRKLLARNIKSSFSSLNFEQALWTIPYDFLFSLNQKLDITYPWRLKRSEITGLPWFYRGLTDEVITRNNTYDLALLFLNQHSIILFGATEQDFIKKNYPVKSKPLFLANVNNSKNIHIKLQQYYEGIPIYKGGVSAHLQENGRKISIVNSHLPTDHLNNIPTVPKLKKEEVIIIVKKLINHYLSSSLAETSIGISAVSTENKDYYEIWFEKTAPANSLIILPFAGKYRLAYEVFASHINNGETWSFFIDAITGIALGKPCLLTFFAEPSFYYKCSSSLLKSIDPDEEITLTQNPCRDFTSLTLNNEELNWPLTDNINYHLDIKNSLIHAKSIYDYLDSYMDNIDSTNNSHAGLIINFSPPDSIDKFNINTNFTPKYQGQSRINFSTNREHGITIDNENKIITNLSLDPDVITHEFTHAWMYSKNPDPFLNEIKSLPFARAWVEGYANYLSRSWGFDITPEKYTNEFPEENLIWAHGSYRFDSWTRSWCMQRIEYDPNRDYFLIPNTYPNSIEGIEARPLDEYEIGMILARSFWNLRQILGSSLADAIILDISAYATGWIINFELIEEALLDNLAKNHGIYADPGVFETLFAYRGIFVNQGVTTLKLINNNIILGTPLGLHYLNIDGSFGTLIDHTILDICIIDQWIIILKKSQDDFTSQLSIKHLDTFFSDPQLEIFIATVDLTSQKLQAYKTNHFLYIICTKQVGVYYWQFDLNIQPADWPQTPQNYSAINISDVWQPVAVGVSNQYLLVLIDQYLRYLPILDLSARWKQWIIPEHRTGLCLCTIDEYILVGTDRGVHIIDSHSRNLSALGLTPNSINLQEYAILALTASKEIHGLNVWAGTAHGLIKLSLENGQTVWSATPVSDANDLLSKLHINVLDADSTKVILGTPFQGVWEYEIASNNAKPISKFNNLAVNRNTYLEQTPMIESLHAGKINLKILTLSKGQYTFRLENQGTILSLDSLSIWQLSTENNTGIFCQKLLVNEIMNLHTGQYYFVFDLQATQGETHLTIFK